MTKRALATQKENSQRQNLLCLFVPKKKVNSDSILKTIKITKNNSKETNKNPKGWIYHHCGKPGHIRPYCYKLHDRKRLNSTNHTYAKKLLKKKGREPF